MVRVRLQLLFISSLALAESTIPCLKIFKSFAKQVITAGWKRNVYVCMKSSYNHCAEAVLRKSRFEGFCSMPRTKQEKVWNWTFVSCFKKSINNLKVKKLVSPQ